MPTAPGPYSPSTWLLPFSATAEHVSEAAGQLLGQQGAASPPRLDPAACALLEMAYLFSLLCSHPRQLHQHVVAPCRLYAFEAAGLLLGQEELPAEDQYALLVALLQPLVQQIERGLQTAGASSEHKRWDERMQSAHL